MFLRALLIAFLIALSPANAQEITGTVDRVIDGDTIQIRELRIRLCGIDAPEDDKPGAADALSAMEQAARFRDVRCVVVGGGTPCDTRSAVINNKRIVAQCFVGDLDLAEHMTRQGLACDWPKFSDGYYGDAACRK